MPFRRRSLHARDFGVSAAGSPSAALRKENMTIIAHLCSIVKREKKLFLLDYGDRHRRACGRARPVAEKEDREAISNAEAITRGRLTLASPHSKRHSASAAQRRMPRCHLWANPPRTNPASATSAPPPGKLPHAQLDSGCNRQPTAASTTGATPTTQGQTTVRILSYGSC